MLSVEHVTKQYGSFTALEDISLAFEAGVYGLLAPNGAGKTTLIKMLTTLLFPTKGKILWDGQDILTMDGDYRGLLGYLPQEFGYYKNYSPRQFLRYMAALQGVGRKTADNRIDELLELVSLSDVRDKKMKQFSGGMIQRVGIAQAMLNDPKLLILDEPTAGLDPKERVRFRNLIHNLSSDRIVILSTHIVSDIETIAGQIVMIRDHKLYCCDTSARICAVLHGKIFEIPEGSTIADSQLLLSERQSENGTMLRIAADVPSTGAVPVMPNLEDAFLYIYRDGQA
ncbi:MAG: ABC transporter ATP-binding protein [Clostridiales bacterium]|nr:ABC transporter ATP-binding protein [Clostridiales bacterium]